MIRVVGFHSRRQGGGAGGKPQGQSTDSGMGESSATQLPRREDVRGRSQLVETRMDFKFRLDITGEPRGFKQSE